MDPNVFVVPETFSYILQTTVVQYCHSERVLLSDI